MLTEVKMTMITKLATMETIALMASAVASSPLGLTTTEEPRYLVVGSCQFVTYRIHLSILVHQA